MDKDLCDIFKLIDLSNAFRSVRRTIPAVGQRRLENDAEHSYQLAALAWYLIEAHDLPLDNNRVIKYCLVHDLVEVYAGDIDPHSSDENAKAAKARKEAQALRKLNRRFDEWRSMTALMRSYERRRDPESRFVYALDKIQPILNIYRDSGDYYRRYKVTLAKWLEYNQKKVQQSPEVMRYFEKLVSLLRRRKGFFFTPSGPQ